MKKFPPPPKIKKHEAEDKRSKMSLESIAWVRACREQGATLKWVAQQLGVSDTTIVRALKVPQ